MKNFFKVSLFLIIAFQASGQDSLEAEIFQHMYDMDTSFWEIKKMANDYLGSSVYRSSSNPSLLMAKQYGRWEAFWQNRVDSTGGFKTSQLVTTNNPPSCNSGGDWSQVGPAVTTQRMGIITNVYIHPQGSQGTIYAGSNTAGLWKSTDGGQSWKCKTDTLKSAGIAITSIVGHPSDTNTIYISTGINHPFSYSYGSGVYMSTDGGESWSVLDPLDFAVDQYWANVVVKLLIVPTTPSPTIYALARNTIYKSTLAGLDFSPVATLPSISDEVDFHDIEYLPGDTTFNTIIVSTKTAATYSKSDSRVYITTDGGSSWTEITPPDYDSLSGIYSGMSVYSIEVSNVAPDKIFCLGAYTIDDTTYCPLLSTSNNGADWYEKTTNTGANFTTGCGGDINTSTQGASRIGFWRHEFEINQVDTNVMYIGNYVVYKTTDGGQSFTQFSKYGASNTHADIRSIQILTSTSGGTNDVVLMGNDGGVAFAKNGVNNCNDWSNLNGTSTNSFQGGELVNTQYFDISTTSSSSSLIAGGSMDNGSYKRELINWTNPYGGDGGQTIISWADTTEIYYRENADLKGSAGTLNIPGNNEFEDFDMVQDPHYPDTLLIGKDGSILKVHVNTSATTINTYNFPGNKDLVCFDIAPSDPNIIYAAVLDLDASKECRLFKSTDKGNSFTDITTQSDIQGYITGDHFKVITDIEIDPDDPNRVWCSYGGFKGRISVLVNDTTFSLISGFPGVPINCLTYQKGSDDVLYVGTDVGVYRYSPSTGIECYSKNLPPVLVSDIEINYCTQEIHIGTYGRGIWKSALEPISAYTLTSSSTLPSGQISNYANDLIIPSGITYTVEGILNMGKDTKILIKPGGKLEVDGGTITNICGETWNGIIVDGQASYLQGSGTHQGVLELTDATIEHAKNAIQVHDGFVSVSHGGGIVKAENTTFKNNWNSVGYSKYHAYDPVDGKELPNAGYFKNCTFTVDDDLRDFQASVPFRGHMSMWDVSGVNVLGCTFENKQSSLAKAEDAGYGILTIDAHFTAEHICTGGANCSSYDTTQFINLFDGIRVSNVSRIYAPVVDKCLFKDCHYGVFNDAVNELEVVRSQFEVGGFRKQVSGSSNIHEGLVLNNAANFIITENSFTNSASNPTEAIRLGTRVVDAPSDTLSSFIYKNTLNGIQFGHLANGVNGKGTAPYTGLEYRCNSHTDNTSDITAYSGLTFDTLVLALHQGSAIRPAGNVFSNAIAYNVNNYDSTRQTGITYHFYTNGTNEEPVDWRNITNAGTVNLNECATIISDTASTNGTSVSIGLSEDERTGLISDFWDANDEYELQLDTLQDSIDAGDTAGWLDEAQNANSGNASSVISDIQNNSPWVSQEVLEAVLDNTAFDAADITTLLEQNPDVLRRVTFMNYVIDSDRLSSAQLDDLYTAMTTITNRTNRESLVSYYNGERDNNAYRIIRDNLSDTSGIDLDTIDYWLQQIPSLETSYMRVELMRQADNWEEAKSIMNDIPNNFTLTSDQSAAHEDYETLHDILYDLDTAGKGYTELDSTDYSTLVTLAGEGENNARAHVQAQSILNYAFGHTCRRPALFPPEEEEKSMAAEEKPEKPIKEELETELPQAGLIVQPNPAKNWLRLGVQFPQGFYEGRLTIVDSYGRIVHTQDVRSEQPNLYLNTTNWSAGTYFVQFEGSEFTAKTIRIIIAK